MSQIDWPSDEEIALAIKQYREMKAKAYSEHLQNVIKLRLANENEISLKAANRLMLPSPTWKDKLIAWLSFKPPENPYEMYDD